MARERMRLTYAQWAGVVAHLQACLPEEGCGLLGGRADQVELVLPIENIDHSPVHFRMAPRALVAAFGRLEALDMELVGAFHSHPVGPFGVSESDVREWQYPEAAMVICALVRETWAARAFTVDDSGVTEMPLQIEEG
jgi:proteasome lid subunit RPN8/RPN11